MRRTLRWWLLGAIWGLAIRRMERYVHGPQRRFYRWWRLGRWVEAQRRRLAVGWHE